MAVKPKALLFDLGGVVVPWVGMEALAEFNNITRDEVSDRFASSDIFRAFERGQASEADFLAELPRVFDLPDGDVAQLWNSWVLPPFPGVLKALEKLKSHFTLACLSNTNALHWTHLSGMMTLGDIFDYPLASHHLQEAKPDTVCYIKALNIMGTAPTEVWFFDDTRANIDAARGLGMTAFHVDRHVGVLPVLQRLRLFS